MLHNAHVLDLEDFLINWNTDDINRALWLEKDYAEYAAKQQALDEIDAGMALAWQLSEPAPAGCKTISQLRKGV